MRQGQYAFLGSGLMLAATITVRADDSAAARALVDKAVKAQGGHARLAKLSAVTAKLKGKFHGLGQAVAFTGELAAQGRDRQKFVIEAEGSDEAFRLVHVLNRDKGWVKLNDDTEKLKKEDLAEAREEAYAGWVATLVPLRDKAFTLSPLGEIKIGKRPALGVKVSSKGHQDIDLYFDKATHFLVKTVAQVKDDGGQEVTEETLFSDYKKVEGTRQAMKFTIKRGGKLYLEAEVTECKLAKKLDDSVFAEP
jgi:hypothetical protein